MTLSFIRFADIMLAALSLSFGLGHFMELPARMAWDQYLWVGSTVQGGLYALSGPLGVLIQIATVIALTVLAMLLRRRGASGVPFTIVAAAMFAIGLLMWWILVYPVNVELAKWVNGPVPANWADWRSLWEWGQAANGLAQFAGFAALIASVLVKKKKDKKDKKDKNQRCHNLATEQDQLCKQCSESQAAALQVKVERSRRRSKR